ncbi:SpoIVB peptidase S55 domain-containing protein [uncultured Nocardioides sp.]|uniref:SpoIVB peptidase S55 domain-containing protein n=1 Tax=uncultured Nocardioides sp. TaxID=198441 RepID=UPI00260FA662|nr:SpoIVB peptidase S55 domain-containing protein [uncultured Nocardioides sp.]
MTVHHRRRRRLASLATFATAGLAVQTVVAVTGAPAQAAPAEDCAAAYPVAELADGDAVSGLTVTRGTEPTGFTGEILGVLEDGIAPDVDMVMAELDMPEFQRTGGIWQGMSGSPVYAEDGRLIGAVAYGLSFGPSPVAGITPFEDMDDYLAAGAPPTRIALTGADARTVAREADIAPSEASRGFSQLPIPLGVSGVSARRLAQVKADGPTSLARNTVVAGKASAAAADADTIVAGGNVAGSAAYGDISFSGVGTATSVCDGRVVGFGHPLAFLGTTTLGLHPADTLYVQPESVGAPFKVANVAPPVGTVTDDRTTGITGTFGAAPEGARVASTVEYAGRSRTGDTEVFASQFLPDVAIYQVLANQDRVVDGPSNGSELMTWTITGSDDGEPFSLSSTDRWSGQDLAFITAFTLAEVVSRVTRIDGVTVDSVTTEANVDDNPERHTLAGVQQLRNGRWVTVTAKAPAQGTAGESMRLRALLAGSAGSKVLPLSPITLPRNAPRRLRLVAQGGDAGFGFVRGSTVDRLRTALASQLRHDQVRVQVGTPDKVQVDRFGGDGGFFSGGRDRRRPSFVRTRTSEPQAVVVKGLRSLRVDVRR